MDIFCNYAVMSNFRIRLSGLSLIMKAGVKNIKTEMAEASKCHDYSECQKNKLI